jgi:hypothetical protein
MAKSKITITFTGVPAVGDQLVFTNSLSPASGDINEVFVALRSRAREVTIGNSPYNTAANFYTAISLDNGNSGLYDLTISAGIITITSTISNAVFTLASFIGDSWRTVEIENNVEPVPIAITNTTFSTEVANACGKVKINVTTNVLATDYYVDNVHTAGNVLNPFIYSVNRGINTKLRVVAADLSEVTTYIKTPAPLASDNIKVGVLNTPNGATLTITLTSDYGLVLQYSLDSVTWQPSNTFTGIAPGNYTIYVKDQIGCLTNKAFVIEVFNPNVTTNCPVSYISESMSIRFKHNEDWDGVDVYKTDSNTLSCEEEVPVPYTYRQLFKPSNMVTTQLLSNYENIVVNVVREDQTRVNVPIELLMKFVNLKDKRDAWVKSISPTLSGIYYTNGDTYDYTTGAVTGTYALNGSLPDYASIGNYIQLDGIGWFLIEDITYDEAFNVDMLVITYAAPTPNYETIVASNWNQKNYNVLEFDLDFAPYLNELIQVEILQTSPGFDDFNYLSEVLQVSNTYKDSLELIWFNYEDSNVFYSTGIKNIGNFLYSSFKSDNDSEVVINKTTNTSIMVNASNYDTKELVVEDLSTCIMKQLVQACLHKGLLINRVPYVAASNPSAENVDSTNLYKVTSPLIKTNPPYLACQPSGEPSPQLTPTSQGFSPAN